MKIKKRKHKASQTNKVLRYKNYIEKKLKSSFERLQIGKLYDLDVVDSGYFSR